MIAGGGQHTFDLVVLALFEDDLERMLVQLRAVLCRQWRGFVDQLDTTSSASSKSSVTGSWVVAT